MHSSRMRTVRSSSCLWGVYLVWGLYLVPGDVPGPGEGVYLVLGGVPGLGVYLVRGVVYLVLGGGVPGPGGCTWSGGYLVPGGLSGPGGCTWSRGVPAQVLPPVDRHTRVKT